MRGCGPPLPPLCKGGRRRCEWGSSGGATRSRVRGLSLFEVLLALAILGGALAAMGQLIANGVQAAVQSKLQTQAALLCESKLAEIAAGAEPMQGANGTSFPDAPGWFWSASATPHGVAGLFVVEVIVERRAAGLGATEFRLKRLLREPAALAPPPPQGGTVN